MDDDVVIIPIKMEIEPTDKQGIIAEVQRIISTYEHMESEIERLDKSRGKNATQGLRTGILTTVFELERLESEYRKLYGQYRESYNQSPDSAETKGLQDQLFDFVNAMEEVVGKQDESILKFAETNTVVKDVVQQVREMQKSLDGAAKSAEGVNEALYGANGKKQLTSPELESAKVRLRAIQQETAAYYYRLRALKQFKKTVDNIYGSVMKLEKRILSFAVKGTKAFLKLATGAWLFHRNIKKATASHDSFGKSLKRGITMLLKYTLGIRSIYILFNKLRHAMIEGMGNLATQFAFVNQQMSSVMTSLFMMKNATAAAAQPLLNILAPVLERISALFNQAAVAAGSFFATLTGQSFVYKALRVQQDYAESLDKTAKSAKEANKQLATFNKLNVLSSKKDSGDANTPMFEVAELVPAASEAAKKIKKLFEDIAFPIRKAWEKEGKFVMDSWKYALGEVKNLIEDIGRDFIEVWKNDRGVKIWRDILHILGDIGLVIGNIAHNIDEAWNKADKGKAILLALQTLISDLTGKIRDMMDYTVEWSKKLDFNNYFESWIALLTQIRPLFNDILDIVEILYEKLVLKFVQYMVEEGLPELHRVIGDIAEKIHAVIDTEAISDFVEVFEQFLEKCWKAFLIILEDIADAFVKIVQSEGFQWIIDKCKEWMRDASPEDIAKAVERFAKALLAFNVALAGLKAGLSVATGLGTFFNLFQSAKLASLTKEVHLLSAAMGGGTAAAGGTGLIGKLFGMNKAAEVLSGGVGKAATAAESAAAAATSSQAAINAAATGAMAEANGLATAATASAGTATAAASTAEGASVAAAGASATILPLVAGIVGAIAGIYDVQKLTEAQRTYSDAFKAHTNETETALTNYEMLYQTKGKEVADEWAKMVYNIDTSGMELNEAQAALEAQVESYWDDTPQNMWEGFKQGWDHYFGTGEGGGLWGLIKDAFGKNGLIGWVGGLLGIASPSTVFKGFGENTILGFIKGLNAEKSPLKTTSDGIWKSVINSAKSLMNTSSLVSVGSNLIAGLKNGLMSQLQSALSAVQNIASQIVNAARNAFQVHSPSKVFMEIGEYLTEGLAVGVEEDADQVSDAFEDMVPGKNLLDKFSNQFIDTLTTMRQESIFIINDIIASIDALMSRMEQIQSFQSVLSNISNVKIDVPKIAVGAVLPSSAEFSKAMYNDNDSSGTSLQDIEDEMITLAGIVKKQNEILEKLLAKDVSISSRDAFNAVRSEADSYFKRTGNAAFSM